jgi:hypothetical protein
VDPNNSSTLLAGAAGGGIWRSTDNGTHRTRVLAYSTYLGGSGREEGNGIAADGSGNTYVTGFTLSGDFPSTADAFQTSQGGGGDAFVTKPNAAGRALVYSTYLARRFVRPARPAGHP